MTHSTKLDAVSRMAQIQNLSREEEEKMHSTTSGLHTIKQADTEDEQSRLMKRSNDVSKNHRYLHQKKSHAIKPLRKKRSDNAFFLPSVAESKGLGEQDWFLKNLFK